MRLSGKWILFLVAIWPSALASGQDWMPPDNPDPHQILNEARADRQAERYDLALAKHVWFHEHALSIDRAFYGVRLSFALNDWNALAKVHPPALARLKAARDEAGQNVTAGRNLRESFHDYCAINDVLHEEQQTQKQFERLDAEAPEQAKEVFDIAQPTLVRARAYSLCGKYIDGPRDCERIIEQYRQLQQLLSDPRFNARNRDFFDRKFEQDITTLVALLTVTDRQEEAGDVAQLARIEHGGAAFDTALDKALSGVVPPPWP